jgi:hypothetical protein
MVMKIVISSFVLFFSMQCISQQAQSNSKTSTGIEQTIVAEPVIEETTPGIAISNKKEKSGQVEPIQPIIEPVDPKAQTTKKKIGG